MPSYQKGRLCLNLNCQHTPLWNKGILDLPTEFSGETYFYCIEVQDGHNKD
jgi:hypothetical protein